MMLRRQDLDRLSWISSNKKIDSWALILRVQAELFASVCTHERASIAAFESLALALIPRIDDEAAAHVMEVLADTPEAPATVIAALRTRLGMMAQPPTKRPAGGEETIAGRGLELQAQVDRAHRDPHRARTLLLADDLPALEAARLYLFADHAQRENIRTALAGAGMAGRRPMRLNRPSPEAAASLLEASDQMDTAAFGARLAECMGLASVPEWRFQLSERHDLLALAVSAIGLGEEDAIRIFLTLVPEISRSVETVFGLVGIFRRTPRSVSTMILEAALDLVIFPQSSPQVSPQHGQDLADRAGPTARQGKMPGLREWGQQLRPQLPDRAG
jgi:uncharacterized protein (DUF2336 family)